MRNVFSKNFIGNQMGQTQLYINYVLILQYTISDEGRGQ